jgi:hypothetical protein
MLRAASRIVGVVMALAGLGFVALPGYVFAIGQWSSGAAMWILCAFFVGAGIGCLLAAWYFLRLDVDEAEDTQVQPTSRFAPHVLTHRREFKVIAQIGLVISLIRLGAAFFGVDWPGRWAALPLFLVWIALMIARPRTVDLNWESVPKRMRPVLRIMWNAVGPALSILVLLLGWSAWSQRPASSRLVGDGLILLLFAWEALLFSYGEMRGQRVVESLR